jgi:hypothetical protein
MTKWQSLTALQQQHAEQVEASIAEVVEPSSADPPEEINAVGQQAVALLQPPLTDKAIERIWRRKRPEIEALYWKILDECEEAGMSPIPDEDDQFSLVETLSDLMRLSFKAGFRTCEKQNESKSKTDPSGFTKRSRSSGRPSRRTSHER